MTPEEFLLEDVTKLAKETVQDLSNPFRWGKFDFNSFAKKVVDMSSRFVERKIEQKRINFEKSRFMK